MSEETYTLLEQIHEVEREIAMRKRVYPGQIAQGRIGETRAQRQIAIMQDVLNTLRATIPT